MSANEGWKSMTYMHVRHGRVVDVAGVGRKKLIEGLERNDSGAATLTARSHARPPRMIEGSWRNSSFRSHATVGWNKVHR